MSEIRKTEVLNTYQDLITNIWARISPTLGNLTMKTIFQRAKFVTEKDWAFMQKMIITNTGVDLSTLREDLVQQELELLRNGFRNFVVTTIDIISSLTGDILVSKIREEINMNPGEING